MRFLKVSSNNFNQIIKEAVKSIKKGKILICPTDTVYGLICDATNGKAVRRLFKIKKRRRLKPIPLFVKDVKMAKKFAEINKTQEKFLKLNWPGKVTAVLKAKSEARKILPKGIISLDNKIGFRTPKYKLVNILLKKLNYPLAETSANISGKTPSTKIREILKQFPLAKNGGGRLDLVLDAGNLKPSKPSMVIDLTDPKMKILRK